jgi:hypothetical protein
MKESESRTIKEEGQRKNERMQRNADQPTIDSSQSTPSEFIN